jgi:drug/metabolite transporter (DMT)-like permease
MSPSVVALVLFAALLHATWNAMLRSGADQLWSVTVMSFATTAIAVPFALALPAPALGSWPYLCLSAILQVAYSMFLAFAYRHAELGQVYPIVRGAVPLLVTTGAALFAGEALRLPALVAIGLISFGIMSLAFGRQRAKPVSVAAALATGLIIASYTVSDGMGVRLANGSNAYVAWLLVIYGMLMPLAFLAARRRLTVDVRAPETRKALLAGVVQLVTYATVLWAFTLSPIGPVSALRETSVVFAALIGHVFLGERLVAQRLGACIVIALGAFLLSYRQ